MRRVHLKWWQDRLGLQTLADLPGILPRVEAALRAKKTEGKGVSGKTLSNMAGALGGFCRWAIDRGYLTDDPLKHLKPFDTEPITRRRAMTSEEIKRLMEAAPEARRLVYALAFTTGLRANELRTLRGRDINPDRPLIHVRAEKSKNRRAAMQPLPVALWEKLLEDTRKMDPDAAFFYVPEHIARAMGKDLKRAGILKTTPEGKIDFHAAKTAYVNLILESGADLKTAMTLARHSSPTLTLNTYGRARQERLNSTSETVGGLVLSKQKNTTGTERRAVGDEMTLKSTTYPALASGSNPVAHPIKKSPGGATERGSAGFFWGD